MSPRAPLVREHKTPFANRLSIIIGKENFQDFAAKIGTPKQSITRWMAGGEPRLSALEAIVKATGCNGHWLLTGDGEPFEKRKI